MAISSFHIPFFVDIFSLPSFLQDEVLIFGYQDCNYRPIHVIPTAFKAPDLNGILGNLGLSQIKTLDLFDGRADYQHDMNLPIPDDMAQAFNTVIDIGSLEHVFDTKQCLWNLFRMVKPGGHLVLHTPCHGYFNHGFHTFSPECLASAAQLNGFDIRYFRYSTRWGVPIDSPDQDANTLLWMAAQKKEHRDDFVIPQQQMWDTFYQR